jgi:hypothetical protein
MLELITIGEPSKEVISTVHDVRDSINLEIAIGEQDYQDVDLTLEYEEDSGEDERILFAVSLDECNWMKAHPSSPAVVDNHEELSNMVGDFVNGNFEEHTPEEKDSLHKKIMETIEKHCEDNYIDGLN